MAAACIFHPTAAPQRVLLSSSCIWSSRRKRRKAAAARSPATASLSELLPRQAHFARGTRRCSAAPLRRNTEQRRHPMESAGAGVGAGAGGGAGASAAAAAVVPAEPSGAPAGAGGQGDAAAAVVVPSCCTAAVLHGVNDLRLQHDWPLPPAPPPGCVRVAMRAVGICGSDVHYLKVRA